MGNRVKRYRIQVDGEPGPWVCGACHAELPCKCPENAQDEPAGEPLPEPGVHVEHTPTPPLSVSGTNREELTMQMAITPMNRRAVELLFNLCLECLENVNVCACHVRGYN